MRVDPIENVMFNRLRAVFPQRVKPPFSYTDFIGESASSGMPMRDSASGEIYAASDAKQFEDDDLGTMEYDPVLGIIHPRAIYLPQTNYFSNGVPPSNASTWPLTPVVQWSSPVVRRPNGTTYTIPSQYLAAQAIGNGSTEVVVQSGWYGSTDLPQTVTSQTTSIGVSKCQGFVAFYYPAPAPTTGTNNPSPPYQPNIHLTQGNSTAICWRVRGSTHPIRWYRIRHIANNEILFEYNDVVDSSGNPDDGIWNSLEAVTLKPLSNNWVTADKVRLGGRYAQYLLTYGGAPVRACFSVRVLAGQMRINFDAETTPFIYPLRDSDENGDFDWYIDRFYYIAYGIPYYWSVQPLKFRAKAAIVSNEIQVGQVLDEEQLANIKYLTHYAPANSKKVHDEDTVGFCPPGSTSTCETFDFSGTSLRYKLAINNTQTGFYRGLPLADTTAAIRAISVDIPSRDWYLINPPTILGGPTIYPFPPPPPKPSAITVSHRFNLQTLSIQSQAQMRFDNFRGNWTNGFGTGYLDTTGHFAVAIELGIAAFGTLHREFTGIGNTDFTNDWGGGGRDDVVLSCADCWLFLDIPVWNVPWFDGWNIYKVMYFLASLGGLTDEQMLFLPYVPESPYDPSPGLPDEEQYFMPVGPAGAPLTRFGGGQRLKDIMLKIACSIGFTLFFNVYGGLNFYKFRVPSVNPFTHVFSHVAGDALDPTQPGLGEIFTGSYRGSLRDVRNSVTVIGVDAQGPLWNPIVAHQADLASVFDDSVLNYKGFHDPMVWADSQFADLGYASRAAYAMLSFLRLPTREVGFRTWYRGSVPVYPGDMIRIIYPRSGASLFNFFVTATQASHVKGQPITLDLQARLIPAFIASPVG